MPTPTPKYIATEEVFVKCYLVLTDSPKTDFSSATASLGRRDILLRFSSATAFSDSSFQLTGEDRHNKNWNIIILLTCLINLTLFTGCWKL